MPMNMNFDRFRVEFSKVFFALAGSVLVAGITPAAHGQAALELLKPGVNKSADSAQQPQADKSVGQIRAITGLISLKNAEGKIRFASTGSKLYVGDVVNTEKKSTAVLEFVDTTQIALRPETRFVVQNYSFKPDEPVADKADFKLVKGGLRTLTGLIGKRGDKDAFKMQSETATIGVRGTDFTARICQAGNCKGIVRAEQAPATQTNATTADVAGRVSQLSGSMSAVSPKGDSRPLQRGSPVFSGDVVKVAEGGFGVLNMADNERLTLPGGSDLEVSAYRYSPTSPQTSVAAYRLLKGAVRTVTGAIGKAEPQNVKFSAATATVGIRGTAFDLSCTTTQTEGGALTTCVIGVNVNLDMRQGQTELFNAGQPGVLVNSNQSAILVAGSTNPPVIGRTVTPVLNNVPNAGPLPENTQPMFEQLSYTPSGQIDKTLDQQGGDGSSEPTGQLFVSVNEGTIIVSNSSGQPIYVNRGEGAVVLTGLNLPPIFLVSPPEILSKDLTLASPPFTAPQCRP